DDTDGFMDFPWDSGCSAPFDTTEFDAPPYPQCFDFADNDGDSLTDWPFDPGCASTSDDDETDPVPLPECFDGLDNDLDSNIDFPYDPGCDSASDDDESNVPNPQCDDGLDNDGDTYIDYPQDVGCSMYYDDDETNPVNPTQCTDRIDNDHNGYIDFPMDPHCDSLTDNDETGPGTPPACDNSVDDDSDSLADFPRDPGCESAVDNDELDPVSPAQCSDGIDNDGDSLIDFPDDYGCDYAADNDEATPAGASLSICHDGVDNDLDGLTDYPYEPGCASTTDPSEYNYEYPPCSDGQDNNGDGQADYPEESYCRFAGGGSEFFTSGFSWRHSREPGPQQDCKAGTKETKTTDMGADCGTYNHIVIRQCTQRTDGSTGWEVIRDDTKCEAAGKKCDVATEICSSCHCYSPEDACSNNRVDSGEACQPPASENSPVTPSPPFGCGFQSQNAHESCSPTCQWEPGPLDGICINPQDASCVPGTMCDPATCACVTQSTTPGTGSHCAGAQPPTGVSGSNNACTPDDCPVNELCLTSLDTSGTANPSLPQCGSAGADPNNCYNPSYGTTTCGCVGIPINLCDGGDNDNPPCSLTGQVATTLDNPPFGTDTSFLFTSTSPSSAGAIILETPVELGNTAIELQFQAYASSPTSAPVTMFLLIGGTPTSTGVVINSYVTGGQFSATTTSWSIPMSAWGSPTGSLTGVRLESTQDSQTTYDNIQLVRG
ncbi:MAG: hypothetical protein Q7S65_06145, partial [Nanoarchaeota archaeon]|nr:hypothetical protein [Nanoarchaeota archaeon]